MVQLNPSEQSEATEQPPLPPAPPAAVEVEVEVAVEVEVVLVDVVAPPAPLLDEVALLPPMPVDDIVAPVE